MNTILPIDQHALDTLAALAKNPAAPFHEWAVARHLLGWLDTMDGVDYRRDEFGNIIAHYVSPNIAAMPESEREPPIAFVSPHGPSRLRDYSPGASVRR